MVDCSTPRGITVSFPGKNLEVYALDADIRKQERHLARAQFELTERAGQLIGRYVDTWDIAVINFEGVRAERMVMPREALEFRRNIDEKNRAILTLADAKAIMDRTDVSLSYEDADVRDIAEDIVEEANTGSVIERIRISEGTDGHPPFVASFADQPDGLLDIPETIIGGLYNMVRNNSTFTIEGTAREAMDELVDSIEARWWIEDDGTLYIGNLDSDMNTYEVGAEGSTFVLSRYSVTQDNNTVSSVIIEADASMDAMENLPESAEGVEITEDNLNIIASAQTSEFEGGTRVVTENKSYDTPEEVEDAALRRLLQESLEDTSGSIEVNGNSTLSVENLAELDVGDIFHIDEGIEEECKEDVYTGPFAVTDIHHRATRSQGWNIDIDVARALDMSYVTTDSVYYDPFEDREYETET